MTGTTTYIQRLLDSNPLRERLLRDVIDDLKLAAGSRGLDLGCGIGLQTLLLSDAIGASGRVTGLDILPDLLSYATELISNADRSDRITFRQGSMDCLPFDENSFDWAWSADCAGYPAGELQTVLSELIRVIQPGGRIFLLGWTSQQLLPGYPLLEARLNATCSAYLPFLSGKQPDSNFMRASYWLRTDGLKDIKVKTYVCDVHSPLAEGQRTALAALFDMLWGSPQVGVAPEDWAVFQRLCTPGSRDFILDVPDYYAFFTYTLFSGVVVKN